ncbi:uncharacterized protein LOC111134313 isoform X1 [Crassostrea virginica]
MFNDEVETSGSEYVPKSSEEEDDDNDDDNIECSRIEDSLVTKKSTCANHSEEKRADHEEFISKRKAYFKNNVPESSEEEDDDNDDDNIECSIEDSLVTKKSTCANHSEEKRADHEEFISKRKAYFKNIHVETYEKKEGKRNYQRLSYCCFCKNSYHSKISKHILAVHATEPEVLQISALQLKSTERKIALQKLQKKGNYYHNCDVLKKGEGILIVYRRPKEDISASDYLPCEFCLGFFHEKQLWLHAKSCELRNNALDSPNNYVRNGRIMLQPFMKCDREEPDSKLNELIINMKETKRNPGLKDICLGDKLIREFGFSLLEKLGTTDEQRKSDCDNIRTKLRSVARLLRKLNENKFVPQDLTCFIRPSEFNNVVAAVKTLYRESDSPQLGITLGHYIKQISLLKASIALEEEDERKKKEANEFQEMYAAHWNSRVACVANRTQRLRALNAPNSMPSTEDLVCLKNYVEQEMKLKMKVMKPSYEQYVQLAHLLIVRIAVFNKRRISEVDQLSITDFENRILGQDIGNNSEIINSLEFSERALLKRMELVEVRGKSTRKLRKVFILLTPDMTAGINHLLSTRIYAGVAPNNRYVFSRSTDLPLDGCLAMRQITTDCPGLSSPDLIRTRLIRKYLATSTQIMDMSGEELKLIADHMGHSVAIHTDIYRLQSSVLERTKVAKALVVLEEGRLKDFKGRNLSSIDINEIPQPNDDPYGADEDEDENVQTEEGHVDSDTVQTEEGHVDSDTETQKPQLPKSRGIKRKKWTREEERELTDAFGTQIQSKSILKTIDIRNAQKKFKLLRERSEAVIRSKVNNIILGKSKVSLQ